MFEYKCKIVKVIDGDTTDVDIDLGFGVWLKKQRIRFHGIDTPESRTRDLEEKKYGLAAKAFVKEYLLLGSTQTLITVKDGVGKYGRILGEILVPGDHPNQSISVNKTLVIEGHAVEYHGGKK